MGRYQEIKNKVKTNGVTFDKQIDDKYISSFINDYNSYAQRAKTDYQKSTYSTSQKMSDDYHKQWMDLNDRAGYIRAYLNANANSIDKNRYNQLMSTLDGIYKDSSAISKSFYDKNSQYRKFKTEEDYTKNSIGWLNPDSGTNKSNASERQKFYNTNKQKITSYQKQIDDLQKQRASFGGVWLWETDERKSDKQLKNSIKDLQDKIKAIETENRQYERTQGVLDRYYGFSQNTDFFAKSANRNHQNPTKEDFDKYNAMINGGVKYDAKGVGYDVFGNVVDENYYKNTLVEPAVKDKLGLFLSSSDKQIQEAYASGSGTGAESVYEKILKDGDLGGWSELTDDEVSTYYYLLNTEGQKSAEKYLTEMQTELNRRQNLKQTQNIQNKLDNGTILEKIALNAASVPASVFGGSVAFSEDALNTLRGRDINPYSAAHSLSNFSQDVRSSTAQNLNDLTDNKEFLGVNLGDVYQSVMSAGDSAMGVGLGGKAYGALMGMNAASSKAKELYESGASKGQIAIGGILAGAAEGVFEKVSIESLVNLKDSKKISQVILNTLKQGGIEASEEMATEVANTLTDALVRGNQSDLNKYVQEYINQGKTESSAQALALLDVGKNVWKSGVGGFISGALLGGTASGAEYSLRSAENLIKDPYIGRQIKTFDNIEPLTEYASGIDKNSKAYKLAQKVYGVNQTLQAEPVQAQEMSSGEAVPLQGRVAARLSAMGEQGNVDVLSSAVAKSVSGETLSRPEQKAISASKAAKTILGEFKSARRASSDRNVGRMYRGVTEAYQARIYDEAEGNISSRLTELGESENIETLSKAVKKTVYGEKLTRKEATALDNSKNAQRVVEEFKSVINPAEGEFTNSWLTDTDTVKDYNRISQLTKGVASPRVTVKSTGDSVKIEGVKSVDDNGNVTLKLDNGETVQADEVDFETSTTENLYSIGSKYGALGVETFVNKYNGEDINRYAPAFDSFYKFGVADPDGKLWESAKNTDFAEWLNPAQAKAAYELGRAYAQNKSQTAQAEINTKRTTNQAKNKTSQIGSQRAREGVDKSKINTENLSPKQKASIDVLEKISAATNGELKFSLFESSVDDKGRRLGANGYYDPGTNTIHLDIEAGIDDAFRQGELDRAMLRTASHELTHFIEKWSPEQYRNLRNFVYETLNRNDPDTVRRLIAAQRINAEKAGHKLSYDEASREVVADACEMLLRDSNAVERLVNENLTLAQKIRDWVSDFVNKIKKAFEGVTARTVEARILEENIRQWSDIQALWDNALENALRSSTAIGTQGENAVETDSKKEYSKRSYYNEYDSLVMRWANSAGTKEGDTKIFCKKSGDYRLLEADGNGGTVEIARGNYKKVSAIYERGIREADRSLHRNLEEYGLDERRHNGYRSFRGGQSGYDGRNNSQTAGAELQSDSTGNNEHNRTGDKRESVKFSERFADIDLEKSSLDYFGRTFSWKETGYVLKNGSKLDFSGKHYGASGGYRTVDHREILDSFPEAVQNELDGNEAMVEFMQRGNIRIMPEGNGINLSVLPTKAQEEALSDFISRVRGEVTLDIDNEYGDTIISVDYPKGTRYDKVLRDIRQYFKDGTEPVISDVSRFRYSLRGEQVSSNTLAKQLKRDYSTEVSATDIKNFIDLVAEEQNKILSNQDYEDLWGKVVEFSKGILRKSKQLDIENQVKADQLQELKDYFRGKKFKLTPDVKREVEYQYGDYKSFKDMMFGKKIYFSENSPYSLDSYWGEICRTFPEIFDEETIPNDQPAAILEAFESFSVTEGLSENSEYFEEMAQDIADRIISSLPVPERAENHNVNLRTDTNLTDRELLANALLTAAKNETEKDYLSRYKKQIDELNEKNRQVAKIRKQIHDISFTKGSDRSQLVALKNRADILESQIQRADKRLLSFEATKALKDVVEREKKQAMKKAKEQGNNKLQDYRQKQKASAIRKGIADIKMDLAHRILKPTDGKYVPAYLVKSMIDVCNAIDTDTGRTAPDGSKTKAQQKRDDLKHSLDILRSDYDRLKTRHDPNYSSEYDEAISQELTELAEAVGNSRVNEMTYPQLEQVYNTLKTIRGTLRDANYQIGINEKIANAKLGEEIVREQGAISRKKGFKALTQKYGDAMAWNTISPMRAVLRMCGYNKDSQLYSLMKQLNEGQRKKDRFVMESHKMFEPLIEGKENKKKYYNAIEKAVDFGITDIDGNPVLMSKMTAMQLAMSWEREMASNGKLSHLYQNGAKIPNHKLLMSGKVSEAVAANNAQHIKVDNDVIVKLAEKFDEWDKKYMETAHEFFDIKSKFALNETSRVVSHRDVAHSVKYIPFTVDGDYVYKAEISDTNQATVRPTLTSMGMLKDTVRNAGQPLVMTSLNHVLDTQIENVARYYGLAIPVRNFNKVWNYMNNNTVSVRASVTKNWGEKGKKLVDDMIRDLQAERVSERSKLLDTANSAFVRSVLNSNISVTIKQLSALPSAFAVLNQRLVPGYVYAQFAKVCVPKVYNRVISEIDEHTAAHWVRRQGLSSQELGDIAKSMGLLKRIDNKLPAALNPTKWIQGMDCLVTASFWDMCKKDIEKTGKYQKDSEEYWNAVTELYNRVIEDTQAVYDTLHRPEVLKTTNFGVRQLFMFRSESLQHSGIVFEKYGNFAVNKDKESGKEFAKACYSQFASALSIASLTVVAAALLHKMNPYRDDDEELTPESIVAEFLNDLTNVLADLIFPVGGAQLQEFIYGKISGNSFNADMLDVPAISIFNDFYKSLNNLWNVVNAEEKDETKIGKAVENLIYKFAGLFGFPAQNAANILKAFWLHIEDAVNGEFGSFEAGVERSNTVNYHRATEAIVEGDIEKYQQVYKELEENGVSADKIQDGIKAQLKDFYLAEMLTDKEVISMLVKYGGDDDEDDAYWTVKSWDEEEEHQGEEDYSYSKYNDLVAAVESGKGIDAAVKELVEHGIEEDTVNSEIKKRTKSSYIQNKISETQSRQILSQYLQLDDFEVYWTIDEWNYYKENSSAESGSYKKYDDLYKVIDQGGDADIAGTVKLYMDNGVSKKSIESALREKYKKEFISLYNTDKSKAATLKNSLLRAYYAAGYDWDTRSKSINKWLEE